MTGLLLQREAFLPNGKLVERAQSGRGGTPESFDTWMAIYAGESEESRIGFLHSVAKPETRNGADGTALAVTVKLAAHLLATPAEILVTGTAWNDGAGRMSEFDFSIRSFGHEMRVAGAIADNTLNLNIDTAGESFPVSFPVNENLMLSGNMGTTTLNLPGLEVGDEVLVEAFDPMTLSTGTARIRCVDTEMLDVLGEPTLTKVIKARHGGIETTFWVTGAEEIVRIKTPFGFEFRKTTKEAALAELKPGDAKDLLETLAVRPTGKQPFRGAEKMRIRIGNMPKEALPPSDEIQRNLGDGVFEIVTPALSAVEDMPPHAQEHLRSDPFVQSESERIIDQAREIVDESDDRWTKISKLYTWVYENIEKTIVISFPSALEVLESREGDCNEHTVLYAALARSVGVPTRIAVGVVWSEQLNGFYYHAWPEVFMDRWIGIDPTLGQPLADATHVKLLTGNIEEWPKLAPYLGQMQIEVESIE